MSPYCIKISYFHNCSIPTVQMQYVLIHVWARLLTLRCHLKRTKIIYSSTAWLERNHSIKCIIEMLTKAVHRCLLAKFLWQSTIVQAAQFSFKDVFKVPETPNCYSPKTSRIIKRHYKWTNASTYRSSLPEGLIKGQTFPLPVKQTTFMTLIKMHHQPNNCKQPDSQE